MRLLADECCDAGMVEALRADGHDVLYAVEIMQGATDDQILETAFEQHRLLVTEDKDFGELVYRMRLPARGIVLIRFDVSQRGLKTHRIQELLEQHGPRLINAFAVLEADKIRIRSLET